MRAYVRGKYMKKLKTIVQRKKWNIILGVLDIIMMIIASYLALLTRFEFYPSQIAPIFLKNAAKYMPLNLFCSIVIFMAYRLYSTQWKYAGVSDFINVVKAAVIAAAFQLIGIYMLQWEIPRSYYFLYLVYLLLGMFFIRLLVRLIQGSEPLKVKDIGKKKVPVMLIGAGEAGSIILNEIKKSTYVTKTIRCIIDDDPAKKGTYLSGIPVVGNRNTILRNAVKFDVEEIILAIPTIEPKDRKDILEICKQTGCRLSILPGLYQLINSEVTVSALREVEIEDLLGREPVKANLPSIMSYVKDRVVFVTGGGGSIGSEICRQIARYQPKKLVIIDNYENNAYEIQMELKRTHPELDLKVLIVSVQNHLRIHNIFEDYKPDIVFHAAKVSEGHITVSPSPTSNNFTARCSAAVPALSALQCAIPVYASISRSKPLTFGPSGAIQLVSNASCTNFCSSPCIVGDAIYIRSFMLSHPPVILSVDMYTLELIFLQLHEYSDLRKMPHDLIQRSVH